jgi:aspartate aminotransferase-like enzyme
MLTFTSAGTGVMESAMQNLCSPGDRVLVVSHGYFGERFAAMADTYGCELVHLRYAWGESPNADEVGEKLEEMGGSKAVFLTHSDTSTGVVSDLRSIAERLNGTDAMIVVDAISSLGAVPRRPGEG